MVLAGSPLLLEDDETDVDFFEQLENDLSENQTFGSSHHLASDCLEFTELHPAQADDLLKQDIDNDVSALEDCAIAKIGEQNIACQLISPERTEEQLKPQDLEPASLVKEGSFAFALPNEESSPVEDLYPGDDSALSLTDQFSSSFDLQPLPPESEKQCKTAYKELQWSSFSDSYSAGDNGALGSFADLMSVLDDNKIETPAQPDAGCKANAGSAWTSVSAREEVQHGFFDTLGDSIEQTNASYSNLQEATELAQASGQGIDWQPYNGELPGISTPPDINIAAQGQQADYGNSWENTYPGWYFDYNANEWRLTDRYDASLVPASTSTVIDKHICTKEEEISFFNDTGIAYPPRDQAEEIVKYPLKVESNWAVNQENTQQIAAWEAQYPGWHYDSQTQTWQQISNYDNGWQSSAESSLHTTNNETLSDYLVQGGDIPNKVINFRSLNWQQSQYELQELQTFKSYSKGLSFEPTTPGSTFISADSVSNAEFIGVQGSVINAEQASNSTYQLDFSNSQIPTSLSGVQGWDAGSYSTGLHAQVGTFGNYQQTDVASSQPNMYIQTSTSSPGISQVSGSNAGRPPHPLVAFAFGGKLVVIKPMASHISDYKQVGSFTNQQTWIPAVYTLSKVVIECNDRKGRSGGTSYFTSLNRNGLSSPLVGGSVSAKELLKWIEDRVSNCEVEEPECTTPDVLRLLWCVLKIACQNFGKLCSMASSTSSQVEDGPEVALGKLLACRKSERSLTKDFSVSCKPLVSVPSEHQLQATALEMMNLLVVGKRKQALQEAQLGQLWGPALVLAWQLGEKFYAETVTLMAEKQFAPGSPLQTLCLLLAGQGAEAITAKAHFPASATGGLHSIGSAYSIQDSIGARLEDWQANLAIIAANRTKGDEQVIMHLGDCLWKANGEVVGAHICYLLAESSFESFSSNARLCLVGADHFKFPRTFATPMAIQRTELYEYAKVLGNPQFILPLFQPYKLLYAHMLAEAGKLTEAIGYCQVVLKTLKNAGRVSEVEYCRQAAMELEDRLRLYSQSGYGMNLAPGKLMGKLMSTIDSTIHKIIGGPPPPPAVQSNGPPPPAVQSNGNFGNTYDSHQTYEKMGTIVPASLIPSASMEPISDKMNGKNYVDVPSRSVSEPDFSKNPKQEVSSLSTSGGYPADSSHHSSREQPSGSYFGRFGSQIFAKAVGFIRTNKKEAKLGEENKFYYDQNLKMWVEKGVEPLAKEAALPPPPTKFASNSESSPSYIMGAAGDESRISNGSISPSSGTPPLPPSANQYSARGRLQGVRSRYVDTFNKGNSVLATKPVQTTIVPAAAVVSTSSPAKIFVPVVNQHFDGGCDAVEVDHGNLIDGGYKENENIQLHPKDSSICTPLMQRHSSVDNVAKQASNTLLHGSDKLSSGGLSKAVSWSGYSSSFEKAGKSFNVPTMSGNEKNLQSTRGEVENDHISNLAGSKSIKEGIMDGFLPPPPHIEPPNLYDIGLDKSMLSVTAYNNAHTEIPGGIPGSTYGEMQEVEL